MARTSQTSRKKAASKKKSYKVTSKQFAKTDGKDKLRQQLLAAGATIDKTLRQGFMVKMTGDQRDCLGSTLAGAHITELHVQGDSNSDMTSTST